MIFCGIAGTLNNQSKEMWLDNFHVVNLEATSTPSPSINSGEPRTSIVFISQLDILIMVLVFKHRQSWEDDDTP